MDYTPHISICIPAYKNISHLKRLLDSVQIQTFLNFEVILTDDSPDDSIKNFIGNANYHYPIRYYKNITAAGSPENWNISISHAIGKWIKIMHDDDWFSDENSLNEFYKKSIKVNTSFIFSGFKNVFLEKEITSISRIKRFEKILLKLSPLSIYKKNYIGHPSTTLIKNNRSEWFDNKLKWVVDIEFYLRLLFENNSFCAISKPLISIGMGTEQITQSSFNNLQIEIPENFYLLQKLGHHVLKNIFVYDHFWRLIRNLEIKSIEEIKTYTKNIDIPDEIEIMVNKIKKIGNKKLKKNGSLSKICMIKSYGLYHLRR